MLFRPILLCLCLAAISASAIEPQEVVPESALAAQAYRKIFQKVDALKEELGDSFQDLLYPEEGGQVTPEQSKLFSDKMDDILDLASGLKDVPRVDWGRMEALEAGGEFYNNFDSVSLMDLSRASMVHAKMQFPDQPDRAIDSIFTTMSAVHHFNQEPILLSILIQNAADSQLLGWIGQMAPEMTPAQRAEVRANLEKLPDSASLAQAIMGEKALMIDCNRRKIKEAMKEWNDAQFGSDGLRFPEDLRMAGIVLLPDAPIQISLEDTRTQRSFWLEKGKTVNGIYLESVDRKTQQAWIRKDDQRAVIDLRARTIENDYIPWEVLFKVFADPYGYFTYSEEEKKEALSSMGIKPETIMAELARADSFYSELLDQLDLPIKEFEQWENARYALIEEDSLLDTLVNHFSGILEMDRSIPERTKSLLLAMEMLDQDKLPDVGLHTIGGESYQITETQEGLLMIPEDHLESERSEKYGITIGLRRNQQ